MKIIPAEAKDKYTIQEQYLNLRVREGLNDDAAWYLIESRIGKVHQFLKDESREYFNLKAVLSESG